MATTFPTDEMAEWWEQWTWNHKVRGSNLLCCKTFFYLYKLRVATTMNEWQIAKITQQMIWVTTMPTVSSRLVGRRSWRDTSVLGDAAKSQREITRILPRHSARQVSSSSKSCLYDDDKLDVGILFTSRRQQFDNVTTTIPSLDLHTLYKCHVFVQHAHATRCGFMFLPNTPKPSTHLYM